MTTNQSYFKSLALQTAIPQPWVLSNSNGNFSLQWLERWEYGQYWNAAQHQFSVSENKDADDDEEDRNGDEEHSDLTMLTKGLDVENDDDNYDSDDFQNDFPVFGAIPTKKLPTTLLSPNIVVVSDEEQWSALFVFARTQQNLCLTERALEEEKFDECLLSKLPTIPFNKDALNSANTKNGLRPSSAAFKTTKRCIRLCRLLLES
jgi:hypothetical protein